MYCYILLIVSKNSKQYISQYIYYSKQTKVLCICTHFDDKWVAGPSLASSSIVTAGRIHTEKAKIAVGFVCYIRSCVL